MSNKFTHLHVHTEYSLLDGLSKVKDLLTHVKKLGMDNLAITDHGVMYGVIEFYKKAKDMGVKPIVGLEAYTVVGDHKDRPERGKVKNNHLLLLAKNEEGYKNMMKLSSISHLEGFYYKPRFSRKLLEKYSKGLIVTSACPAGEVGQALINDDYKEAKGVAKWFQDVFGDDYYLEIQRHDFARFLDTAEVPEIKAEVQKMVEVEKKITEGVVKLSRDLGIPLVATNDAHYIKKEDASAQDALICIATGKNVEDIQRLRFIDTPDYYVKSPDEMAGIFEDLPDAIKNTMEIAQKCNLEISTLGKWFFPEFKLPKGKTAEGVLKDLTNKALPKKVEKVTKEVKKRLKHELGIIIEKGYAPYFLIVMDIVNWANERGIITNTRGSAAGSLVSYCLGITTIDPIKYYLPFERFLNPFRPSPPDIDIDVSDNRREEIFEYIGKKYGKDRVAQVCTFGRMLSRGSVRDIARVLGYEYAVGDKIAKLIPPPKQGFPITIPKALKEVSELKDLYDSDSDVKKVLDLAIQVEGNARHVSVHAAAAVISPTKLTEFTPLQKEPSGEKIITQYEMHASEDVGLIKFDILGIRNLSILGSAIDIVKKRTGKKVKILDIPLDDKKTYKMLGRGETMGVFQLASSGMTKYIKDLQPERIEDIMAMVALYRPGPITVIPEYIKRKKNPKLVKYLDPRMEKFLGSSYGLIVYQDDLLYSAIDLAGYDWKEADKFRKAVGKKIPEEMAAQKEKFTKGIIKNGQTEKFAENLWELFEPFQAYGFNKAHAASYGIVAYQTAFMKANYPVEFMTALLTAESSDTEKIAEAINECRRMGIGVLPPDINKSDVKFKVVNVTGSLEDKAIRFGLSAIKHVGKAAIEAILKPRKKEGFISFADFLSKVDNRKVNKKVVESLIKVGALSSFGNRASLLESMDEIRNKVTKPKSLKGQQGLFSSKEIAKKSASNAVVFENVPEFGEEELETLEGELLGFSLSARPIHELLGDLSHAASHKIEEIDSEKDIKKSIKVACIVSEVRVVVTKKSGQEMAFAKVSDGTGTLNLVVFPSIYQETKSLWLDKVPLVVSGKVDFREDETSLIVDKVSTKKDLVNLPKSTKKDGVYISIPKNSDPQVLKRLKTLLLKNKGSKSAILVFEGKDKKLKLPFGINWNKSLAFDIKDLLDSREN